MKASTLEWGIFVWRAGSEHWVHSNIKLNLNNSNNYLPLYTLSCLSSSVKLAKSIRLSPLTNHAKMKTLKRKPFLSRILLRYRKIVVYILPLRVGTPRNFLKRENANYLVHCWEYRPRNKNTWLLTLVLLITDRVTLANTALLWGSWKTEVMPACSSARHGKDQGMLYVEALWDRQARL